MCLRVVYLRNHQGLAKMECSRFRTTVFLIPGVELLPVQTRVVGRRFVRKENTSNRNHRVVAWQARPDNSARVHGKDFWQSLL